MSIDVDHAGMRAAASAITALGGDLDSSCASIPSSAGSGEAGMVVADVLATFSATVAQLVVEADVIGTRVAECEVEYARTDSATVERMSGMFAGPGG